MVLTNPLRKNLQTLQNLDPQKDTVNLDEAKILHRYPVEKKSFVCNFLRWLVRRIFCTHFPSNPYLDQATKVILEQVDKLKQCSTEDKFLIDKAFINLSQIIKKNKGRDGQSVARIAQKIQNLPIEQILNKNEPFVPKKPEALIHAKENKTQKKKAAKGRNLPNNNSAHAIPKNNEPDKDLEKPEITKQPDQKILVNEKLQDENKHIDNGIPKEKNTHEKEIEQRLEIIDVLTERLNENDEWMSDSDEELGNEDNLNIANLEGAQPIQEVKVQIKENKPQEQVIEIPQPPVKKVFKGNQEPIDTLIKGLTYVNQIDDHEYSIAKYVEKIQDHQAIVISNNISEKNLATFIKTYPLFNDQIKPIIISKVLDQGLIGKQDFKQFFEQVKDEKPDIWKEASKAFIKSNKNKKMIDFIQFTRSGLLCLSIENMSVIFEDQIKLNNKEFALHLFEHFLKLKAPEIQQKFLNNLELFLRSVVLPLNGEDKEYWLKFSYDNRNSR